MISQVYINGNAYELVEVGKLSQSLGEAFEIRGSNCSAVVIDDDMNLFHSLRTLPEGEVIIMEIFDENDERIFLGDCDPTQCEHDEEKKVTSLEAESLFERVKGTVVQDQTWARPAGNTYQIAEEAILGEGPADWLILEHVTNIFPDDELQVEAVVNGRVQTKKMKVLYAEASTNRVYLDGKPSAILEVGTTVTRLNNEVRFLSIKDAVSRLNNDIEALGSVISRPLGIEGGMGSALGWLGVNGVLDDQIFTVSIENELGDIVLDEPVTAPYPVPRFEGTLGTVDLMTGKGVNGVIARFVSPSDTGSSVQMVEFGFGTDPVLSSWELPNSDYLKAVDWTPHLAVEPSSFLPAIGNAKTSAFDLAAGKRYRIYIVFHPEQVEVEKLVSHDWDPVTRTWINETLINGSLTTAPSFIGCLTYDQVSLKLYAQGDGAIYQVNRGNGVFTPVASGLQTTGDIACMSLDRLMAMGTRNSMVLFNLDNFSEIETIQTGYKCFAETCRMWKGRLYFVGIDSETTALFCYEKIDSEWQEVFKDVLTDFQARNATLIARQDHIFIEVHGLLFTHSATLLPVITKADVSGMTVGEVTQNLVFFANAYIKDDPEGVIRIIPKTTIPDPTFDVTDVDEIVRRANWSEQYQRIVVEGDSDDIRGAAITGIPGESWEISSAPFVFMSSHARAIALTLLNWHKYKRREIDLTTDQLNGAQVLDTFTFQGVVYQIQHIEPEHETEGPNETPETLQSVNALEVLSHEL